MHCSLLAPGLGEWLNPRGKLTLFGIKGRVYYPIPRDKFAVELPPPAEFFDSQTTGTLKNVKLLPKRGLSVYFPRVARPLLIKGLNIVRLLL